MDVSPRKSLKRTAEPVDDWLYNEGYFRKHVPRDPTCLFRAFAEQIYSTQHYHIRVRRECVDFMRKNCHLFEQSISIPFESYLEQMSCFTEWGGQSEIKAMSLLYEREIFIFDGVKMIAKAATNNGFKDTVYLCQTPQKQYESVYPRDFIPSAAYCQSLVYQTLYKGVFKMANVDETVQKMLHDRTANFRHDRFFLKGNMEIREKLATELLTKIEKGSGESRDEEKTIARCVTPFPYRVAKALDPNIYRNTDFDIWHEIRREVRNAGWTRWNGTELQVGGKCLVQVDYKDQKLDETNNNNNFRETRIDEAENDGDNGNETRVVAATTTTTTSVKREPVMLYGHIQEMSKNEGPVVVFIEELGEKRTLPYAALKPIVPKRGKQNNWSLNNFRKNSTYDTNQKWKRTWSSNGRKSSKEASGPCCATKNPVDGNNNTNDNKTDDKTKVDELSEFWDEEISDEKNGMKNYTMETYNSCQGFTVEKTIDVRPVTVLLDKALPAIRGQSQSRNSEDYEKSSGSSSESTKISSSNDNASPSALGVVPESVMQPLQQISINSPCEAFYGSHSVMPTIFPINQSMMCATPDVNAYPVQFPGFTDQPPAPGSLLDQTIRAINFSAPASLDVNGSDLPFSDPVTLRFFYNLGLEYFRAGNTWTYGPNGLPMSIPPNFMPQGNFIAQPNNGPPNEFQNNNNNNNNNHHRGSSNVISSGEDENLRSRQAFHAPGRRRSDDTSYMGKFNNNHHQQMTKTFGNRKIDISNNSIVGRNSEAGGKQIFENSQRSQIYASNDRAREQYANSRKNGPQSRFKKNIDGRNRNSQTSNLHNQESDNHNNASFHRSTTPSSLVDSSATPQFSGPKSSVLEAQRQTGNQPLWHPQQSIQQRQRQAASPSFVNSTATNYQTNYGPQSATIYTAMPFYPSDPDAPPAPTSTTLTPTTAATFYAHPQAAFYSLPYLSTNQPQQHSDMNDGNNHAGSFVSPIYPPIGDNYHQPLATIYPQYPYHPQQHQTIYSGIQQQQQQQQQSPINQENWFPIAGQAPQYLQYPPLQNSPSPPSLNPAAVSP